MSVISTTRMTARQFDLLGEDPPGVRLELVNGEIAVSPSPRPRHSHIDRQLSYYLTDHLNRFDLGKLFGDVDTVFGEYDVRRPDLIYFSKAKLHLINPDKPFSVPPDLCIEILSPSSGTIDRVDKFAQYAAGGVAFYWIVDPVEKIIEAFELRDGRYKPVGRGNGSDGVTFPPFPQLLLPLGKLWFPENDELGCGSNV